MTSLLQAVRHNQYNVLRVLVRLPFGSQSEELTTALLYAVKAGFVECVDVLISAGADPNAQDAYDNTPLICACQVGSVTTVRMLLEARAVVDFRNNSRETALHHCAKYGHERCTELLLASGADPLVQDHLWRTPLMLAARHAPKPLATMRMLTEAGSDVNTQSSDHRTVLHYAAMRGIEIKGLLAAGAKMDIRDAEGNCPLHLSASAGHDDVTGALLGRGADPNATNYVNATPLHLAAGEGHVACVETLVLHGSDPQAVDSAGYLPISHAVQHNKPAVVLSFLAQNFFPDSRRRQRAPKSDVSPVNPVRVALEKNHFHLAKPLVLGGCDTAPLRERHLLAERRIWHDEVQMMDFLWLKNYVQQPVSLLERCRAVIRRQLDNPLHDAQHLPIPNQLRQFLQLSDLADLCSAP